jgi:hypothetical protein
MAAHAKEWNDLLEARLVRAEARNARIVEQLEELIRRTEALVGPREAEPRPALTVIEGGDDA